MARKSRANNVLILSDAKNMMWKAGLYSRLSVEDGDDTEQNSIGTKRKSAGITSRTRRILFLLTHTRIVAARGWILNARTLRG